MHKAYTFLERRPQALSERRPHALSERPPRALVAQSQALAVPLQPSAVQFRVLAAILAALLLSFAALPVWAHTPLFDCFDSGDDTITCEGGFSDGSSAVGVSIRVLDAQGKVLEQGELDAQGSIVLARPEGEFSVVFAASEEHSLTVLGDDII